MIRIFFPWVLVIYLSMVLSTSPKDEKIIYIEQFGSYYEFNKFYLNEFTGCHEGFDNLSNKEVVICGSYSKKEVLLKSGYINWKLKGIL